VTPRFVTLVMDIENNSRTNGQLQGLAALKSSRYSDKYFKKEVNQKRHENTYYQIGGKRN
jgi:hypothetical protein